MPVCCLDARVNAGSPTIQAICAVITWSLECLGKGVYPTARHDGTSWHKKEDASRKARNGMKFPGKAALVQTRGDWDWNCIASGLGHPLGTNFQACVGFARLSLAIGDIFSSQRWLKVS